MGGGATAGGHDGVGGAIVAVAPLARHQEAHGAVVGQPLDVLHGNGTALRGQGLGIPKEQVEIDGHRLHKVAVHAPVQVGQRLRSSDLVHLLVREAVARHAEQINATVLGAHGYHVANCEKDKG